MKIILASNSPRRKQFLLDYGYEFEIIKSDFDESSINESSPAKMVKELAFNKAKSVFNKRTDKDILVIGADTIVVYKGNILGKPKDKDDAIETLKTLSNNAHYVLTGYAIITRDKTIVRYEKSKVYFNNLNEDLIQEYVSTNKPLDKAGSYGIQDGYDLIKKYKGSYNNIVGLPIEKMNKIIKKLMKKQG